MKEIKFEKIPVGIFDKVKSNKEEFVEKFIDELEELFPETVKDGKVDFQALLERFGEYQDRNERYELTWVGKDKARQESFEDIVGKTLKYIEEDSKNPETTENLYIEGDNLEVLKLLRKSYYGKIKMIYIDPPYNRRKGDDLIYKDDFTLTKEEYDQLKGDVDEYGNRLVKNSADSGRYHSNWLNMMYPRLQVARDLLTEDGVIFISIDDNEVQNLRKICDEIFKEENFISTISVENNPKGRKNSSHISVSSEYLLMYAKSIKFSKFKEVIPKNASDMSLDEDGRYVHNSGKRVLVGENSFNEYVTNTNSEKNYSVYFNKDRSIIKLKTEKLDETDKELLNEGFKKYCSFYDGKLIENTYTKVKFLELFEAKALQFTEDKIYEKNFNDTIRMKSLLTNRKYEAIVNGVREEFSLNLTTTGAGTYLKELFKSNNLLFEASKNVNFIKLIIKLLEDDFIILDFFSGSSTTADAVMQLNAEDNHNHKFIMVQLPEPTNKKDYKTICDIGKARIRKAGDKVKQELQEKYDNAFEEERETIKNPDELDIGFKVFRVENTNFRRIKEAENQNIDTKYKSLSEKDLEDFNPHFTDLDIVYELMLRRQDIELTEEIKKLDKIGDRTFIVGDTMLVCLEEKITEEIVEEIGKIDTDLSWIILRDSAFDDDCDLKVNTTRKLRSIIKSSKKKDQKIYWI